MRKLLTVLGIIVLSSSISNAQADCNGTPPDGLPPLAAYSLFYTNYQNGDYEFALKYGRWLSCAKPEAIEGNPKYSLSRVYERLTKIYEEVGRKKEDPTVKAAYMDTTLMLYNEALELFSDNSDEVYDIHLRKGRFFLANYDFIDNGLEKAYNEFQAMFDLNAEKTTQLGNGYYVQVLLDFYVNRNMKEEAQNLIDMATPYAGAKTLSLLEDKQKDLLGTPEEQLEYYNAILAEEPENLEALRAVASAHEQLDNQQELADVRRKLHELQPTYDTALDLARIERSNANYKGAIGYFKEALKMATDDEQRKMRNLDLAAVSTSADQLQAAKRYAQAAIRIDSGFGPAYLEMARIYAQAITDCTADRKLEAQDRMVYWVVLDYLNKAKQMDPNVTNTANNMIGTYEPVAPTSEDKFLRLNLEDGDSVTIDGSVNACYSWINETTTVR